MTTTRLAGLEVPMPTRGPPLVPRKMMRVRGLSLCANTAGAASAPAAPSPRPSIARRSIMISSSIVLLRKNLAAAEHSVESGETDGDRDCDQCVTDSPKHPLAGAAEQ